jgi:SAM-dependent methyltransferase
MWQIEARICRKLAGAGRGGTVLDVGCGSGHLLSVIGPKVGIGIDHNPSAVALAQTSFPHFDFRLVDARGPGIPEKSIDCVVSMHLFEHLSEPVAALKDWRTMLKPKGKVVIATPNAGFSHPEIFEDPDHKHIYSGPELAGMVESVGLSVERVFTVGLSVLHLRFFWRFQRFVPMLEMPPWGGLRWRGQTLFLSAVNGS